MSPPSEASPGPGAPPMLVRAVQHLLRPLVRLLVANQLTYPVLSDLLKRVYVDTAERDFAIEGKAQTASRLTLLTGIHRKEIQRLRGSPPTDYAPPRSVSLGARLVARWTGSPEYLDADGQPKALARQASEARSGEVSFEGLVASVSTDIRPRSVIDEWRRLGVVEADPDGRLRLVVSAFVPAHGLVEKAHYFGRNIHDHLAAGAHNLGGEEPPMMERSVYYEDLSAESVQELEHLAERRGMASMQAVNSRALELQQLDASERSPGERSERMSFGMYFLRAPQDQEGVDEESGDA